MYLLFQLIYHTNNPEAPEEFYQCADIAVKYDWIEWIMKPECCN